MMKVIISGAAGHMGRVVADCAAAADDVTVVAGLDQKSGDTGAFPIYADFDACTEDADVIIDFSHFSAFPKVIAFAEKRRLPLVIATTGLTDEDEARIAEKAKLFPIFKTANMSLGINVIADVLQRISGLLTPGFDVEIVEKHHNRKVDAPSGTAILLATTREGSRGSGSTTCTSRRTSGSSITAPRTAGWRGRRPPMSITTAPGFPWRRSCRSRTSRRPGRRWST